jgi:origin recognition complex subunit 1
VYKDELLDDDGTETYCCRFAVNSQRGLYYEFEWEGHRDTALEGDGEGDGDVWDVLVDDDMERRRKAKVKKADTKSRNTVRPKKRVKQEDSEEDTSEAEEVVESDDGGSEDEYESQSDSDEEDEEPGPSDSDLPTTDEGSDDEFGDPRTPSKKRKRSNLTSSPTKSIRTPSRRTSTTIPTTPRKSTKRRKTVAPTPHSRKSIATRKQKQQVRVRPPPPLTSHLQLENLPTDPWLRAMHVLHVGARPDILPCREEEYARCLRAVEELVEEGSGGCVCKHFFVFIITKPVIEYFLLKDISGVPGTGKTATVHAIVRELKRMAEESVCNSRPSLPVLSFSTNSPITGSQPIYICRNKRTKNPGSNRRLQSPLGSCFRSRLVERGSFEDQREGELEVPQ